MTNINGARCCSRIFYILNITGSLWKLMPYPMQESVKHVNCTVIKFMLRHLNCIVYPVFGIHTWAFDFVGPINSPS